ncbi:MAG: NAD-binding protein [Phycisphaerae bacterium]|nr:NAD-binding protein [Phycisphaerae bacterium]NUQ46051.1 NAD-binding protein [Phycisphaerae bacterium]
MMRPVPIDRIRLVRRRSLKDSRLWREWCFIASTLRHFSLRFALIGVIVFGGALLFWNLESHSFSESLFFTWALVFGEPPEEFPEKLPLQILFFAVPVLGLLVVLEAMVEFALILRDRRRHEQSWCRTMAASFSNHIVLVGLGKLGFRTYKLLRRLGESVVVLERESDTAFLEEVRAEGTPVLIGDARRDIMLEHANVARARSIILATNDDLANLEIALDARRLAPNVRVVMRMFDQNMADKIRDGFNIHIAMSQSAMSAPAFATAAIDPSIVNSFVVEDQLIVMRVWNVRAGGPLCGKTVGQVMSDHGVGVVEQKSRGGVVRLFPSPEARVEEGDELLVQGLFDTFARLKPFG